MSASDSKSLPKRRATVATMLPVNPFEVIVSFIFNVKFLLYSSCYNQVHQSCTKKMYKGTVFFIYMNTKRCQCCSKESVSELFFDEYFLILFFIFWKFQAFM